jgi:hypothetical protein
VEINYKNIDFWVSVYHKTVNGSTIVVFPKEFKIRSNTGATCEIDGNTCDSTVQFPIVNAVYVKVGATEPGMWFPTGQKKLALDNITGGAFTTAH